MPSDCKLLQSHNWTISTATISFDTFHHIIAGRTSNGTGSHQASNPSTEESLWPVPVATREDLERAVTAANNAFATWRLTPFEERRKRCQALADAIMLHKTQFTEINAAETGQTLEGAAADASLAYDNLVKIPAQTIPELMEHSDENVRVITRHLPLGAVAAICPWNFPFYLASGKIAHAVYTGNTVILKPSPFAPYSVLKLAELAQQFFPPGVIQALSGIEDLGPWMTEHPGIAKISFTGSSATGKKVLASAAATLKRVTLELGGNDACIVCGDVDLESVIPQIIEDTFIHSGQSCIASKRIYVHVSIFEPFLRAFSEASKALKLGEGILSALQNRVHYDKVRAIYDDCITNQYEFATETIHNEQHGTGFFISPAIVVNPPDESRLVQEEQFGPIVPVLSWNDESELLLRVNGTDQGLGSTVWCRDNVTAERIASQIEAGSVWINRGAIPLPTALFEGIKQSGYGGEGGMRGLLNYCSPRTLHYAKTK